MVNLGRKYIGETTGNLYHIYRHHDDFEIMINHKGPFTCNHLVTDTDHYMMNKGNKYVGAVFERIIKTIEPVVDVTGKKIEIKVVVGDILEYSEKVVGIISPANSDWSSSSGVGRVIKEKAGRLLFDELSKKKTQNAGTVLITKGYDLGCKNIIHVVVPTYVNGFQGEMELISKCYSRVLEEARDLQLRTIAIPSLGTGGKGFPIEIAAKEAIRSLCQFVEKNEGELDRIYLVCHSEETAQKYQLFLDKMEKSCVFT